MASFPSSAYAWLLKAEEDLQGAKYLLLREDLSVLTCFHAQQALEKGLKGVAALLGAEEIPRTHNLVELLGLVTGFGVAAPVSEEELATLYSYAVLIRYEDSLTPTHESAQQAVSMADLVVSWARELISAS